ncbi:serine/threonine-protein kinase [Streptomyces sp. MI02-7b]|uniref:serine/threonine-protein kinase n=1 Tax=Streptomyces sp. MI02-7b TaxID=462941 RepID=UPI0029ABCA26|nr:serine/threonine-protein kinase [Streptomyces sp. MI02-7b]MDX3076586.1 serine/threonine-protein kinase [Streptomyces sp. MI02-7b]
MPASGGPGAGPEAERPEYAGQYLLESRLGAGGMGVVHLSRSTSGMRLAIKVVHEELAADPEFRARFRQEVGAARRVSGAFTAPVVDADPDAERPWMATLYIPGPTLAQFVKRNGSVAPAQVRYLMAGLAEALRDIHRVDVVHRDLKPSNVLLAADGPKVIDFGISRPSDSDLRTETGKLIGTPPFMAPEQFRQPRSVGPAADVFAMASVLVHAATGRSPFTSDSPYIVAYQVVHEEPQLEGIPADLRPLIERCLAKNPDDRPTPDTLMTELREISASYDTETFSSFDLEYPIAARLAPRHGHPLPEHGPGGPATSEARDDLTAGTASRQGKRWRVAAAAALTALAAVGAFTALGHFGTPGQAEAGKVRPKAPAAVFEPWSAASLGAGQSRGMTACSYGGNALYCTRKGYEAARLNPDDGTLQWAVRTNGDHGADSAPGRPVLYGGVLHVTADEGNRLDGLDPATGGRLWSLDVSASKGAFYDTGETVLLGGRSEVVTAVDGVTGKERWRGKLRGHTHPFFVRYADTGPLYAVESTGDGRHTLVSVVDPADGTVRRQRQFEGQLAPIGGSGTDLFLTAMDDYSRTDGVVRIDTADWSLRRVPLTGPLDAAQAVVQGGTVYVLAYGGALVAVDTSRPGLPAERAQRWRLESSVSHGSLPVAVGDRLYFSSSDGRVLAVDAQRGTFIGQTSPRLGTVMANTESPPSPVVADGKVFATAPDGTVFAVDAKDPSRW